MAISLSNGANAGLFDQLKKDLSKMQEQVEGLQQGGNLPKIQTPNTNNSTSIKSSTSNNATTDTSNAGMVKGEAKVEYICRQHWQTGKVNPDTVFKKLPKGNKKILESDFGLSIDAVDLTLNNAPKKGGDKEVASLAFYTNAFETGAMAYVFDQFLKTKGKRSEYLSIIKQVANSNAGFSADKKALKRDAQQMYGIILLYYNAKGVDGFSYLKNASKGDVSKALISTYHIGHRAYFGIKEGRDLSKAANWMLKSFNAVEQRQRDANSGQTAIPLGREFADLVKNEFYALVSEPDYGRRDLYRDLIQQAQQMQASFAQEMENAKGQVPDITSVTKAYLKKRKIVEIKILRSIGDEERAGQEEQLLQKFVDDKNLDDQKNDDFSWISEQTTAHIEEGLASVNALDDGEKKEFVESMGDLGSLMTEMERIKMGLTARVLMGEISLLSYAAAGPIVNGMKTGCDLYDRLKNVGKKVGAPIGEVTFSGDTSVVEDSFDLGS